MQAWKYWKIPKLETHFWFVLIYILLRFWHVELLWIQIHVVLNTTGVMIIAGWTFF